jgi:hypothetical protein
VSFQTAWRNRTVASTAFGEVPVLGLAELRANKLASGRPKDLADVALLDELALASEPVGAKRRTRAATRGPRRSPAAPRRRPGR